MNEIIRIHIAKLPFNIEVAAKAQLEKYLKALEMYLHDADVYGDIEQRIVEILAERGVKTDGVIGVADVEAIKGQLGEPEAFLDETADTAPATRTNDKRLFRDPSTGVLGGVASGLAAYLGISVIWVRLTIVILALASFGWVLILYVLMWIILPPIRTAADKLQSEGKSVTVPGMQQIAQSVSFDSSNRDKRILKGLTVLLGFGFSLAAIGALVASAVGSYAFLFHDVGIEGYYWITGHEAMYLITSLLALSGILLAGLFSLLAYMSFTQRINRRMCVTAGVIVLLGLCSFGSAIAIGWHHGQMVARYYQEHRVTKKLPVPATMTSVTSLNVEAGFGDVRYFVSNQQTAHIETFADPKNGYPLPKVTLTVKDGVLLVKSDLENKCTYGCTDTKLIISGPALKSITVTSGGVTYADANQASLEILAKGFGQHVELLRGHIDQLTAILEEGSSLDASATSLVNPHLEMATNTDATLGTVKSLQIVGGTACPAGGQSRVEADAVLDGSIMINGQKVSATTAAIGCTRLNVHSTE